MSRGLHQVRNDTPRRLKTVKEKASSSCGKLIEQAIQKTCSG